MNEYIFLILSILFFFIAFLFKGSNNKKIQGSEKLEKLGKEYLKKITKKYSKTQKLEKELKDQKEELKSLIKEKEPKKENKKKITPSFTIIFGTQSGTARRFSKDLCKESIETYKYNCKIKNASKVKSIDDFNNNKLLIFIFSTYGNGIPSDDSVEFTNMIEKNEFWDNLTNKNMKYCIFGLGDSNYAKFNAQAKRLDKTFSKYFQCLIPLTLGDDSCNLEEQFDQWMIKFFEEVPKFFNN